MGFLQKQRTSNFTVTTSALAALRTTSVDTNCLSIARLQALMALARECRAMDVSHDIGH